MRNRLRQAMEAAEAAERATAAKAEQLANPVKGRLPQPFELRYDNGKVSVVVGHAELAERLGLKASTLSVMLSLGKGRLRRSDANGDEFTVVKLPRPTRPKRPDPVPGRKPGRPPRLAKTL